MFKSIRHHIRNLEPQRTLKVSAENVKGSLIRNYASTASADFPGRKYTVHYDRVAGYYLITRTA